MNEPHIEHTVGFVEHETLDGIERHESLSDQVEQAAGRGDQGIHARFQGIGLRPLVHASNDHSMTQSGIFTVIAETVRNLDGEFPRRREDQRPDRATLAGDRIPGQVLQNGDGECRCFACARLGRTEQVASAQSGRDSLSLNGRGLRISFFRKRPEQRLDDLKLFEFHTNRFAVRRDGVNKLRITRGREKRMRQTDTQCYRLQR